MENGDVLPPVPQQPTVTSKDNRIEFTSLLSANAAVRRLEAKLAFVSDELANVTKLKDDSLAALLRSEEQYQRQQVDHKELVDRLLAQQAQSLEEARARTTAQVAAAAAEVLQFTINEITRRLPIEFIVSYGFLQMQRWQSKAERLEKSVAQLGDQLVAGKAVEVDADVKIKRLQGEVKTLQLKLESASAATSPSTVTAVVWCVVGLPRAVLRSCWPDVIALASLQARSSYGRLCIGSVHERRTAQGASRSGVPANEGGCSF